MDSRQYDRSRRPRSRSPDRHVRREPARHYEQSRPRSRDRDRRRSHSRSRSPRREGKDSNLANSRARSRSRERYSRRSRSRSREPQRPTRHFRSRSRSKSHSRERKRERRHRSRSASSSSSDDEERRQRRKEKKEKKRAKKERKKAKAASSSSAKWGKYGIISETDIFNKTDEFYAWLVEERLLNPETLPKDQEKKEFSRFVEDYNTATLPHQKYYSLATHETRMAAIRAGEILPPSDGGYNPDEDMKDLQSRKKRKNAETETQFTKEQLDELRKVQHERFQVGKMRVLGMNIAPSMGVRMDGTSFE